MSWGYGYGEKGTGATKRKKGKGWEGRWWRSRVASVNRRRTARKANEGIHDGE